MNKAKEQSRKSTRPLMNKAKEQSRKRIVDQIPDRNVKMLSCISSAEPSHSQARGSVAAKDLQGVSVTRLVNGAPTVELKIEKIQPNL